jgi:hypothetical protein
MQNHAYIELLEEEDARSRLSVVLHELMHHFYDSAPAAKHAALIEEFRRARPAWRMAAYSYFNEANATAAGLLVERRLREPADYERWAAIPNNVYSQPWIAALGLATAPVLDDALRTKRTLFSGYADEYLTAAEAALGPRTAHAHFLLASRVTIYANDRLRDAYKMFRERVPSIVHTTGWEGLQRFPELPVVLITLDAERAALERRIGEHRKIVTISGATPAEVEQAVERFALLPF